MVLIRLRRYSLLLSMAWLGLQGQAAGQCAQRNEEILKAGILNFFGKERFAIMQKRTFGFEIAYGRHSGAVEIKVQRKGKQKQLSDTVAAILKRFLEQTAAPQLCQEDPGKVLIDERTSFDTIPAGQDPLIKLTPGNADAWNDTFKRLIMRFRALYPDDCVQLGCVRGVSYIVLPLQQPVISRILYAGCDTGGRAAAFLLRFSAFLERKMALPYPVTTEGCAPDYLEKGPQAPVPEEEWVWCMVNRFGYARYFVFKVPIADCDSL